MLAKVSASALVVSGLVCAVGAGAQPDPVTTTQPVVKVIDVVPEASPSRNVGAAQVSYIVRDAANTPLAGVAVVLDFAGCPNIRLCTTSVPPGLTVNCEGATRTVTGTTDAQGKVTFAVPGYSNPHPGVLGRCVAVTAGNVPLDNLRACAPDYDGLNGVNGLDLSYLAGDLFGGSLVPPIYFGRSDYNSDGVVNGIDLGLWAVIFFEGQYTLSCATLCQSLAGGLSRRSSPDP